MAAAASRSAATTATTPCYAPFRLIPWGTEDRKLPFHLRTSTRGTSDSLTGRENEFLEIVITMTAPVFVNRHG